MVTLFHDMMHKEVEVYVDDMIVKAHKTEDHATNLERLFKRLRKFQLRLNPTKCTFGVTSEKLLGFVVSERGIEVDPDKVQAIRDLPPPKTQKEVRGFLGRLNYIARFISQLTLKCDLIFKLLRKHNLGAWNEECQVAFDKVKEYLLSLLVLVPPVAGRPLFLYLTICFTYLPREENQMADALATLAAMFNVGTDVKIQPIMINLRECPYPEQSSENDKKTIRRLAMNFFLDGDILYKRSRDQVLLRCADLVEARRIVEEGHEGICGAHASGHMLARQVIRAGFVPSFKIKHHNSVPYRPKMNGVVETANKNIKRIIEKMTDVYKDWHEKLPFALHAYRTTVRTSTGATLFSLVYGMEAVFPIEVEIPSLRVLKEVQLEEAEWVNTRYEQLNLIEEKRLTALCHGQLYQKRMMKAYGKKVHPRQFQEGKLILKRILPNQQDPRGKWTLNWEGPFVVKKVFSRGTLILAEMDRREFSNPVNADAVKKYFA
ncbi:RNA-directed DNA polymerase (Reverse transcriptase), Ribonuclease H, putative [Theobroma cacao]|uniref:RNA-directed DNA polymerase (Reverse transcriptase), Ribonuclease H, putative n=1 Tax=Theobroma cacao TaxID=3641 RepID=A0A061FUX6_THECC|nr:RNA-directed DNA polymerase (Reverse transcriptase), Ribonuclease H, putative [Theobroma cacao]